MQQFTDEKNRKWTLEINVTAIKRVRALLQIDLLTEMDGNMLQATIDDVVKMGDILYALCKPQCDAMPISDEEFGEGLAGDSLDRATEAFLEELVNFFRAGKRTILRKSLAKIEAAEKKMLELGNRKIDSPQVDEGIERELALRAKKMDEEIAKLGQEEPKPTPGS